jgi:hypothetical protein
LYTDNTVQPQKITECYFGETFSREGQCQNVV